MSDVSRHSDVLRDVSRHSDVMSDVSHHLVVLPASRTGASEGAGSISSCIAAGCSTREFATGAKLNTSQPSDM